MESAESIVSPSQHCRHKKTRSRLTLLLSVLTLSISSACTNVYVSKQDGTINVERHLGFVSVEAPSNSALQEIRLEGAGFLKTSDGFSIGYHNGSVISASPDCKIVLIVETARELELLIDLLKDYGKVCATQPIPIERQQSTQGGNLS